VFLIGRLEENPSRSGRTLIKGGLSRRGKTTVGGENKTPSSKVTSSTRGRGVSTAEKGALRRESNTEPARSGPGRRSERSRSGPGGRHCSRSMLLSDRRGETRDVWPQSIEGGLVDGGKGDRCQAMDSWSRESPLNEGERPTFQRVVCVRQKEPRVLKLNVHLNKKNDRYRYCSIQSPLLGIDGRGDRKVKIANNCKLGSSGDAADNAKKSSKPSVSRERAISTHRLQEERGRAQNGIAAV